MEIKKLFAFFCLMVIATGIHAQTIHGKLVDEQQHPVAYANIVLQQADSTFVCGTASDEKGSFRLTKVSPGNYRLIIQSLGSQSIRLDLDGFSQSADLGIITLQTSYQQLDEVTVVANQLTATADRKLVFPNRKQVKASANGLDLLKRLMLPRLNINPMDGSVGTTDGGTVQFCINGRKASKEEVTALQPDEIIRVETEEDPGVRYDDAAILINYVIRRYDMGGSFGYNGMQCIENLFGRHNLNGKLNFGKSEASFYYGTNQQFFKEVWANRTETFLFEDGSMYHRTQEILPGKVESLNHWGGLTYNLQDNDRYMLNISTGFSHYIQPNWVEKGKLYTEEYPNSITDRTTHQHERSLSPWVDIYYQRNLKNRQFIAFNTVGTYIDTNNRNRYQEFLDNEPVVNYSSAVQGQKYSLIAEGVYEKGFENKGKLIAGIRHTQGYSNNSYEGTLQYHTRMRQANSYGYAQYSGQSGKLKYRLGMGVTRSWLHQEGEEDYETWSLNPRLNLSYHLNDQWSASLQGSINTIHPSLSELSAIDQLVDSLQIRRGNPGLKPYDYYHTVFRLNYNRDKWNVGFYSNYHYRDNVIMGHVYRENDKFIHSYANHPDYQNWRTGINVRVGMLWDMLQLSGLLESNSYWSHGVNFSHTDHSFGLQLQADLMYKNLTFSAGYQNNCDYFWGEKLNTGEVIHMIQAQYRIKRLNIGAMMLNPFYSKDGYHRNTDFLNKDAGYRYRNYIGDASRPIVLTMAWNFSCGREYKSGSKRMSNSDTESGVM